MTTRVCKCMSTNKFWQSTFLLTLSQWNREAWTITGLEWAPHPVSSEVTSSQSAFINTSAVQWLSIIPYSWKVPFKNNRQMGMEPG